MWHRQAGEKNNWYARFLLFLYMGTDRTLLGAVHVAQKSAKKRSSSVPGSWFDTSQQWNWNARAEAYDAHLQAEYEKSQALLREFEQAEIARIMSEGYAAIHERVRKLGEIADRLIGYLDDENNIWLPDVKSIGAQRVDLVRFNDSLFSEIRGYLGDIAAETGGRVKVSKQELTGKDGTPLRAVVVIPEVDGDDSSS